MTPLAVTEENTKHETTAEKEFEKRINLLPDENIEFIKKSTVMTGKLIGQNRGLVVLTNKRIIFFLYHFFNPAEFLSIPLNDISRLNFKILGFLLKGAQRVICLEYNNKSILFGITYDQNRWRSLSDPKETLDFFGILKKKLPDCIIDETGISTKAWDYNLSIAGAVIGFFIAFSLIGIGGILVCLLIPLGYVLGFFTGKIVNKLTK